MEAILFIGIQGAGKSSFYKQTFFNTHVRINLDMLKTRHRESILVQACVAAQQPFVVDNTNFSIEQRAKYISIARAAGFRVVGYYFPSQPLDAVRRNSQRTGKERVPDQAIWGTHKQLQPPTLQEGFDRLYRVQVGENYGFSVEEQPHEI